MSVSLPGKRGVSLDRLKTLMLIAEAGGVSKAAAGDPSRQSLYSRQMKELEEGLGVLLLDRSSVPLRLTPEGQQIESLTRRYLDDLERVILEHSGGRQVVRIGAGESVIQWLLLPLLAPWAALGGPAFRFENLRSRDAEEGVRKGRLDVAVIGMKSPPDDLEHARICGYGLDLIYAETTLAKKPQKWRDLAGKSLVILEGSNSLRRHIEELAADMKNPPVISLECSSYPQVIQACLEAGFIGVVPNLVRASNRYPGLEIAKMADLDRHRVELILLWDADSFENKKDTRAAVERLLAGAGR